MLSLRYILWPQLKIETTRQRAVHVMLVFSIQLGLAARDTRKVVSDISGFLR